MLVGVLSRAGLNFRLSREISSEAVLSIGVISLAAFVMLLPAILNRYLFLDETWYTVRELLSWPNGWGALGRPLLHYMMRATEHVEAAFGLNAIYFYRLAGVLFLAVTGGLIFGWLRKFDYSRFDATFYSIGLISLPAFQILAATSVQLGAALIATMLAADLVWPVITNDVSRRDGICRSVAGALLCFVALCIYQISFLMVFAMLLIPVLQVSRRDTQRCIAIALAYAALAAITVVYYSAWKFLYVAPADGVNQQYSPHAATLSAVVSGLQTFIPGPFRQVANLWYVEDLQPSPFLYISAAAVLISFGRLLHAERLFGLLKIVVAIGTLVVCDVFRLSAPNKPPTYTTLHALSAAWWFLIIWSIQNLFGRTRLAQYTALASGVTGLVLATWTTGYIAARNSAQFRAIEDGLRAKPNAGKVHIFGSTSNYPQLYEYGWTSGSDTSYVRALTNLVASRTLERRPEIHITDVMSLGPSGLNECHKPDLAIRLPSPTNRCIGGGCTLSDEQIEGADWETCKFSSAITDQ
jgi:hypothetical protein